MIFYNMDCSKRPAIETTKNPDEGSIGVFMEWAQ